MLNSCKMVYPTEFTTKLVIILVLVVVALAEPSQCLVTQIESPAAKFESLLDLAEAILKLCGNSPIVNFIDFDVQKAFIDSLIEEEDSQTNSPGMTRRLLNMSRNLNETIVNQRNGVDYKKYKKSSVKFINMIENANLKSMRVRNGKQNRVSLKDFPEDPAQKHQEVPNEFLDSMWNRFKNEPPASYMLPYYYILSIRTNVLSLFKFSDTEGILEKRALEEYGQSLDDLLTTNCELFDEAVRNTYAFNVNHMRYFGIACGLLTNVNACTDKVYDTLVKLDEKTFAKMHDKGAYLLPIIGLCMNNRDLFPKRTDDSQNMMTDLYRIALSKFKIMFSPT